MEPQFSVKCFAYSILYQMTNVIGSSPSDGCGQHGNMLDEESVHIGRKRDTVLSLVAGIPFH